MTNPAPDSPKAIELDRHDGTPSLVRNGWAPRSLKQKLHAYLRREPDGLTTPQPALKRLEEPQLPTLGG